MMHLLSAITATWILNRKFTFAHRQLGAAHREYLRYLGVQILGLIVNIGTFALCLWLVPWMKEHPFAALCAGSAVALGFNFFSARTFVFLGNNPRSESDTA